jgi:MYXO-CTERM domain-containing protein
MKAADPAFRTLVTTTLNEAQSNGVDSSINIMVPVVNDMEPRGGADTRSQYDGYASSGNEVWMYQSCMSHGCGGAFGQNMGGAVADATFGGWPTYAIDASAVRNRAMEWLSYKDQVHSELYYETTLHLDTAWTDSWDFGGNGDGTLFYPGKPSVIGGSTDVPVESIRLKMIREGIEDYEYLKMLSDLGEGDFAMQEASALFPAASASSSVDPAALYAAREQLAQHLDAHFPAPADGSTSTGSTGSTASSTGATSGSTGSSTGGTGTPIAVPSNDRLSNGQLPADAKQALCSIGNCPGKGGCSSGGGPASLLGLAIAALGLRRRREG